MKQFDPASLSVAERYKLLIGCVVPRPIAFVSTVSPQGVANLAPFSFFAGVGSNPMTVAFCPANTHEGGEKDSLRNAKPTSEGGMGEFVVNIASERYIREVAGAAEPLPAEESEFDLVGLTRGPCRVVAPPRVIESPAAFECVTEFVHRTNPGEPGGGNLVLGRVVHVWIEDEAVNKRMHVDPDVLRAVGRMGGSEYCRTGDRFALPVGRSALESPDPGGV